MSQPRYMLDTNVVIDIRQERTSVLDRFGRLMRGEAVMSIISFGELRFGAEKSIHRDRDLRRIARLAAAISVTDLPRQAAAEYGRVRAHLERAGKIIGPNDLWIAAHARAAGLTLVTSNEREFRRVPGLAVENWAAEAA